MGLFFGGANRSEVELFWGRFGFFYNLLSLGIIKKSRGVL